MLIRRFRTFTHALPPPLTLPTPTRQPEERKNSTTSSLALDVVRKKVPAQIERSIVKIGWGGPQNLPWSTDHLLDEMLITEVSYSCGIDFSAESAV